MIVTSPNARYSGTIGGDVFVEGVCHDPNPANLWYYQARGFGMDATPDAAPEETPDDTPGDAPKFTVPARPDARAKKADWQAYATALGLDPVGMTTEQIIAMVDAFEADNPVSSEDGEK